MSPEGREAAVAAQREMRSLLYDLLSWEQMRDMVVDIYTQVFTEDEIKDLIQFYQSPIGQKVIKKMPELIQASMQKTQTLIQKRMPELQERLKKTLSDLEAKYKK